MESSKLSKTSILALSSGLSGSLYLIGFTLPAFLLMHVLIPPLFALPLVLLVLSFSFGLAGMVKTKESTLGRAFAAIGFFIPLVTIFAFLILLSSGVAVIRFM